MFIAGPYFGTLGVKGKLPCGHAKYEKNLVNTYRKTTITSRRVLLPSVSSLGCLYTTASPHTGVHAAVVIHNHIIRLSSLWKLADQVVRN